MAVAESRLTDQANKTNEKKCKTENDSRTKVYQRLHGGRTVVSVRVKPELKEGLKRFCKANGLSICHITEGLWTAFLYGVGVKIKLVNQSPTIDLTLVRDVKRIRRYAVEEVGRCMVFWCRKAGTEHLLELSTGKIWDFCHDHSVGLKGFERLEQDGILS